jgi:hypothetical protein
VSPEFGNDQLRTECAVKDDRTAREKEMESLFNRIIRSLEHSFTCEMIASDFEFNSSVLPLSATSDNILSIALENNYSQIALCDKHDMITHYIPVDLTNNVCADPLPISLQHLIAGEAPISLAPRYLKQQQFRFVLIHDAVKKILTSADLDKLPMRVYISTLLSHLESLLAEAIISKLCDEQWMSMLSKKRRGEVNNLYRQKHSLDMDIRLLDCTMLIDKATIVKKNPALRMQLSGLSNNCIKSEASAFNDLRNHLYHNQSLLNGKNAEYLDERITLMHQWINAFSQEIKGADDASLGNLPILSE